MREHISITNNTVNLQFQKQSFHWKRVLNSGLFKAVIKKKKKKLCMFGQKPIQKIPTW